MNKIAARLVGNQALVGNLQAILDGPGGTKEEERPETVEVPAELFQAAAYALLESGHLQLLTPDLWRPERTNGVLILKRDWVGEAVVALEAPRPAPESLRTPRVCAAELLHSFVNASGQRCLEIPVMVFTKEILAHMSGFRDGKIVAVIMKTATSSSVGHAVLTRQQVITIVDFLDPDGAGERAKERQAAAAALAEELHLPTRERRGQKFRIPAELIRKALNLLPEESNAWLERKLKHLDQRGRVRMTRQEVYNLCDALDPAGIKDRQQACREARHQKRLNPGGNGKGGKARRRARAARRPAKRGSLLEPSKRAALAEDNSETGL